MAEQTLTEKQNEAAAKGNQDAQELVSAQSSAQYGPRGFDIDALKTGSWNFLDLLFTLMFDTDNFDMKCRVYGYCVGDDKPDYTRRVVSTVTSSNVPKAVPEDILEEDKNVSEAIEEHINEGRLNPLTCNNLLRKDLLEAATPGSDAEKYLGIIIKGVSEYNKNLGEGQTPLDPCLLANQLWQESKFDPMALGHLCHAIGIAQFTVETAVQYKEYFLTKEEQEHFKNYRKDPALKTELEELLKKRLEDPELSIRAAVAHMGHLTNKFGGDQVLAMVAYNGGEGGVDAKGNIVGPIQHVALRMGIDPEVVKDIDALMALEEGGEKVMTGTSWMRTMLEERAELGIKAYGDKTQEDVDGSYRVVTYNYIANSVSGLWTPEKQEESAALLKDKLTERGYVMQPDGTVIQENQENSISTRLDHASDVFKENFGKARIGHEDEGTKETPSTPDPTPDMTQ